MIYEKNQEIKRNKLNKSQISHRLGIDYKTVMKYLDMLPDGFAKKQTLAKESAKKSDKYKGKKWAIYFTYLFLHNGDLRYKCSIIDLHDRSVVASITDPHITSDLAIRTL